MLVWKYSSIHKSCFSTNSGLALMTKYKTNQELHSTWMDLIVRRLWKAKWEKAQLLKSCIHIKDPDIARRSWTVPPAPEKHLRGSVRGSHPGKVGPMLPEWSVWQGKGIGKIRACFLSLCPQQFRGVFHYLSYSQFVFFWLNYPFFQRSILWNQHRANKLRTTPQQLFRRNENCFWQLYLLTPCSLMNFFFFPKIC